MRIKPKDGVLRKTGAKGFYYAVLKPPALPLRCIAARSLCSSARRPKHENRPFMDVSRAACGMVRFVHVSANGAISIGNPLNYLLFQLFPPRARLKTSQRFTLFKRSLL